MFGVPDEWFLVLKRLRSLLASQHWPSRCQICQTWPRQPLCEDCISRFAQPKPRCWTCALAISDPGCNCAHETPPLDACLCAVDYDYPWADCVTRFKFHNTPQTARHLGQLMHHAPWVEHTLDSAHWILPLPLSAQRLRERGYNQALELAKSLVPSKVQSTWLCRHEGEAHQVGASRQERFDNVRGTFWIHPDAQSILKNQRIVLIDDVMTSGATMFEAARTLRQAGVAHIAGLVFARTPSRYGARQ